MYFQSLDLFFINKYKTEIKIFHSSNKQPIKRRSHLRKLWGAVKRILHPNRDAQITDPAWAQTVSQFFSDKAKSVGRLVEAEVARQGLDTTPTCVDTLADLPQILDTLSPVTVCEVSKLLQKIPNKSNTLDFLPTKLLKDYHTLWAPIIANMANLSFSTGTFPSSFKFARVAPILKKPGLPLDDPASYRPISNLMTLSKVLERH